MEYFKLNILMPDDKVINLNCINQSTNDKICILDLNANDWFFEEKIMYDKYVAPSACLQIDHRFMIELPLHWYVLVGDKITGDMELVSIEEVSMFDYQVFCINPYKSFYPMFYPIEIMDIYTHHSSWFTPSLEEHTLLSVVVGEEQTKIIKDEQKNSYPVCIFCSDKKDKKFIDVHISDLF